MISTVESTQLNGSCLRLASSDALCRRFNAVIDRISQQMHKRITDLIDDGAIQLGLRTDNDQIDFLVQRFGHVSNHARKAAEYRIDRNHAQLENNVLKITANTAHMLNRLGQISPLYFLGKLLQSGTVDKQFAK
ncbi:hypothetical protein D3C77_416030 [compost metagenome]